MSIQINSLTGNEINNDSIYYQDENGIVVTTDKCWKYIPSENITTKAEIADSDCYIKENTPEYLNQAKTQEFGGASASSKDGALNRAKYFFGFKNLEMCNIQYSNDSAIYSKEIKVLGQYITLSAKEIEGINSSVEYYVVDGINEIPILANGINKSLQEKLYYDMTTRFDINSSEEIILYEDGVVSSKSYNELTYDDFENHTYNITYTPSSDELKYAPNNDTIRIKIVIRCFGDSFIPIKINNILINQYGADLSWN